MPRQSSIKRLPPDILNKLNELLRDPRVTQVDAVVKINKILEEEGYPDKITRSAVNRYDRIMRKHGERARQAREIADMWIGKLGAAPQGKLGLLVNEMLRTLSFDLAIFLQEDEINADNAPAMGKMLKDLSSSMEKLERAASENTKREEQIRKQEAEKAIAAIDQAEKGDEKMTPERLKAIIMESYGV